MKLQPETRAQVAAMVGANVRRYRERARLSQQALADHVGMQRANIDRIEDGAVCARIDTLYTIACALGVALSTLVTPYRPKVTWRERLAREREAGDAHGL